MIESTLLIVFLGNIGCKAPYKNIKEFGDGGWDLDCMMEVKVRDSYVYRLTFVNNSHHPFQMALESRHDNWFGAKPYQVFDGFQIPTFSISNSNMRYIVEDSCIK